MYLNIRGLRKASNLTLEEFAQRLGIKRYQTVSKYEKEPDKIPETIQKLIRYEFAEYLPEEERLTVHVEAKEDSADYSLIEDLKKENEYLKRDLESQKKITALLEEQIAMYKKLLETKEAGQSKQA